MLHIQCSRGVFLLWVVFGLPSRVPTGMRSFIFVKGGELNKIKAFLREHKIAILAVVLLVTPAVSWAWVVIATILSLVNWLGVLVVAAFFGARAIKKHF